MINRIITPNINRPIFKGTFNKYFKPAPSLDTFEYQDNSTTRLKGDLARKLSVQDEATFLLAHGVDKNVVSVIKKLDTTCAKKAQMLFLNGLPPRDLEEFCQCDDKKFEKIMKLLPFTRNRNNILELVSYKDEKFDKIIKYLNANMSTHLAQCAVCEDEPITFFRLDNLIERKINGSDAFKIAFHPDCAERFSKYLKRGLDFRSASILANIDKMEEFKEKDIIKLVKFLKSFEKTGLEEISQDISEFLVPLSYKENKNEFFEFLKKIDAEKLLSNNPKMRDYSPREMMLFLKYHFFNDNKISNQKIVFDKDLKEHLENNYLSAKKLADLLSAYPEIDKKVGEIPHDWKNETKIDDEKLKEQIFDIIIDFNQTRDISAFEANLSDLLNKQVKLSHIQDGYWGSGYRLQIENAKDTCLKLYHKTTKKEDETYDLDLHGQKIEPQTALFLNKNANNFVKLFFTKLCGIGDSDGFLVTQYLDRYTIPIQECKETKKGLVVKPRDNHNDKNAINGVIFDFGDIFVSDFKVSDK